jgi:hypothetical protein
MTEHCKAISNRMYALACLFPLLAVSLIEMFRGNLIALLGGDTAAHYYYTSLRALPLAMFATIFVSLKSPLAATRPGLDECEYSRTITIRCSA